MEPPEFQPPSPKPRPKIPHRYTSFESYCRELADRVEGHIKGNVIGQTAKKEIGYAVEILRRIGDTDAAT